jgi:hypothetical protein
MSPTRARPFTPEGSADIEWMLGDLATIGRAADDAEIAPGETEVNATPVAVATDVAVGVQAQRDPVRGTEQETEHGRETYLSHLLFFLFDTDIQVGDIVRVNSGFYTGQHLRITFIVAYSQSHLECDAIYDRDLTEADTLG